MSEFSNPYRPGEPVSDPAMLFGRQDAADWLDLQISGGSRTMVLSALPLVGKTSFLRHVDTLQNQPALGLLVSLAELSLNRLERGQGEAEQSLNTVLQVMLEQLLPQLMLLRIIHDNYAPASPRVASALRELFTVVNRNLSADRPLMLYVDDLHLLVRDDLALVSSFLTSLMPLLDECPALRLVFAINQDKLKLIRHPLLDGAPVYGLGTLPTDASINMVTIPVKGILRFDYGVTKRIAEVNSHHPYYLSLFCHTLLNRQVHDGWVNQQDFDTTLAEILESRIEPFAQIWDESTWAERAVLAGMAAIQGAHGPITGQEVIRYLQRQRQGVDAGVVNHALTVLAERGVLIPMGAVSYRFHVELLRFWLREHTDPAEIIDQVNWNRAAAQLKPPPRTSRRTAAAAPHRTSPAARRPRKARPRWLWPVVVGGSLFLCLLLAAAALFFIQSPGALFAFVSPPPPTPTATPTADGDIAPLTDAPGTGTPPALTEPTPTPSPTPALVVARTLPSITYMGRDVDQNWRVYVMDADGSNQTALTPAEQGDDTSPIWSADGQKIAFVSRRDGNREIYVMDATGENVANVTRHPADDWTPAWSPDGAKLAFSSFRDGSWEIFVMDTACLSEPASCPNALTQITSNGQGNLSPAWSPDGARLAFNSKANDNWDVFTMSAQGVDVRQITVSPDNDLAPVWSPDGSLIAFESNRDGNVDVFVIGANGGTPRNITNLALADDHGPTWSPDGQQLVFYSNREGNWDIFAVPLEGGPVTNLTKTPARDEQTPAWRP